MAPQLLCLLEHPTQYDPPLWKRMTERGQLVPHVHYAAFDTPEDPEIRQKVSWGFRPGDGFSLVQDTLQSILRRLIGGTLKPTAILVSGWTKRSTWTAAAAAQLRRIPVILPTDKTLREPSLPEPGGTASALFHVAKNRLFQGFYTTGSLGTEALLQSGVPRERIATGLYPVDVKWWRSRQQEQQATSQELRQWAGPNAQVVLAVSKLSERENPLLILEGFARLHRTLPSARLIYVGDGPMRSQVEARIRSLEITPVVRLAGYIPYETLAGYYGAADLFVHAPKREPWGISLSEAMACGVPVVATATVGSAHDLVIGGKTGFISAPDDPEDLARALKNGAMLDKRTLEGALATAVDRIDVASASQELEGLVSRLQFPTEWVPVHQALAKNLGAHWQRRLTQGGSSWNK